MRLKSGQRAIFTSSDSSWSSNLKLELEKLSSGHKNRENNQINAFYHFEEMSFFLGVGTKKEIESVRNSEVTGN